jgi:hypothetical protein
MPFSTLPALAWYTVSVDKPKYGNKTKKAFLAKRVRMEKDDRFEVVWATLAGRGIIEEWERGATTAEDVVDDAKQLLHRFRTWEGHTSSTRPKREVPVDPSERERDTTEAFREYLAVHAAQRPIVRRFRREYLPDGRLLTDDHDISRLLVEQHVAKTETTNLQQYLDENRGKPNDEPVRIEFPTGPPPGDDEPGFRTMEELAEEAAEEEIDQMRQMEESFWGGSREPEISEDDWLFLDEDATDEEIAEERRWVRENNKAWEGYFGWHLETLGEWLADKYPWENVGDAVVFLISGRPPRLAKPLSATEDYANATYSLTFSPWISEETLMRAYRAIRGPSPGDKTVRVLRFVSGQADDDGILPSWSTLCDRWDAANPDESFSDRSALYKAYKRAVEALVPPYLLPTENAATWSQRFELPTWA